jgi:5,10-methylene-tetrahydrofolate dehydrogenase/methenyl tetrahydrofolate cyclohydrolase
VYRGNTLNAFNKDYMEFIGDMKVIDKEYLGGYSTVPGGVGPLCVANVANNLLKAYRL